MLEVFDRSTRRRSAILQNAFDMEEEQNLNALSTFQFSLPYNDPKNEYCKPFDFVRLDGGPLYRIMDDGCQKAETGELVYQCEHVIATLLDKLLFGYHVVGNRGVYTEDCIRYVLDQQPVKNWVLGVCEFKRQFEYGWEHENLLGALFSIPKPLAEQYIWTFDTSSYPWVLNLKRMEVKHQPDLYIRNAHNLIDLSRDRTRTSVCTRLYPLGYGEGVNQLGIKDVNGGIPYLQSPPDIVAKYGIIERVWVDRRYENPESLLAAAKSMLTELQEPVEAYGASFADLEQRGETKPGATVRIIDTELQMDKSVLVTKVKKTYGDILSSSIEIANRSVDIASTVADLADRQRIEQTYAQGATQIYSQSIQENADRETGVVMDFTIPQEMRIINKVLCKVRMESFRAYSKATADAGQSSQTSDSGGGSSATSSSGGGTSRSTDADGGDSLTSASGGGTTATSSNNGGFSKSSNAPGGIEAYYTGYASGSGSHRHSTGVGIHYHTVEVGNHNHNVSVPAHTHTVKVPNHSHDFTVPAHTHSVQIPSHSHRFEIPGHEHEITAGIFRFGNPQTFALYVNGERKAAFQSSSEEIDLTPYLTDGESGKIQRGSWQSVEIRPDDLAYISISLCIQGFVQSRGDMTV